MSAAPSQPAPPARAIPTSALASIVQGLAKASALWAPLAHHDPAERASVRLLATPGYDVWLIGWWPGQRVGLHDHGDAVGALTVVAGSLVDATLEEGHLRRRLIRVGETRSLEEGAVHDVQNAGTTPATSIHAYSPPLVTMSYYELGAGAPTRSEVIVPEVPVLTGAPAVHPSISGGPASR